MQAIDAVEAGIKEVELDNQEQYFVGVGGYPNRDGIMELDAAIMDYQCRYGAVMALTKISTPISVARTILEKCVHNVLVGEGALKWAYENGFQEDSNLLTAPIYQEWLNWSRQQNQLLSQSKESNNPNKKKNKDTDSHDTVGVICLDKEGHLCVGTSTSGWKYKRPGRVGDSPLVGSGLYCHGLYGGAVATGDGEEIMRTCLSFIVVEFIRQGKSPQEACRLGIERILELKLLNSLNHDTNTPDTQSNINNNNNNNSLNSEQKSMHEKLTVGVIAMDINGNIGAASTLDESNRHRGLPAFPVMCWKSGQEVVEILASLEGVSY